MITHDSISSKAELSSGVATSNFTIKSSPAAFRILASGLYANKIRSIIRELSCNARDSHVASGNPDPWEIHMPTTYEPYFYVKDQGLGLSHEEVTTIYTTFFESTKTDSDDYVGCLGLGSKSPYSYTDNFTITAIKDGKLNVYSAFIDDTGLPTVAHLFSDVTDQPNGVEVRFAVNTKDFSTFANEAQHALRWFDQMPKGNLTVAPPRIDRIELVDGVVAETVSNYSGMVAIMGGVCYPIEVQHPKLTQYAYLAAYKLVLRFDIGELEVQPSREGLSYTNATVDAISDQLLLITRSIGTYCEAQLNAAVTVFDKIAVRSKLTSYPITAHVARVSYSNWLTNSKLIEQFPHIDRDQIQLDRTKYDLTIVRKYDVSRYRNSTAKKVDVNCDLMLSMGDLALGYTNVIYNDANVSQKDLLEHFNHSRKRGMLVFNKPAKGQFDVDQLIRDMCGYVVECTSQMNILRTQRAKTVKHAGIYTLVQSKARDRKLIWQEAIVSDISGCVYVDLSNRQIDDVKFRHYMDQLHDAFGAKLIGISTTSKVDRSQAIRLDDYLKKWVDDNINEQTIKLYAARIVQSGFSCVPYTWERMRDLLRPHVSEIDDPVLKTLCKSVDVAQGKVWDNLSSLICPMLSADMQTHRVQLLTDIRKCFNQYKFIDFDMSSGITTETKLQFIKVLNFIFNTFNKEKSE